MDVLEYLRKKVDVKRPVKVEKNSLNSAYSRIVKETDICFTVKGEMQNDSNN